MITLTNEQKARVFAMYLGCSTSSPIDTTYLYGVSEDRTLIHRTYQLNKSVSSGSFDSTKLILTPLSAITDEDAITCASMLAKRGYGSANAAKRCISVHAKNGFTYDACMFLIQRGYAVPLFIAPNHPNNGKTAIELGIAIDKTTL